MKKGLVIAGIIAASLVAVFGVVAVSLWIYVAGFYDAANESRIAANSRDQEAQQVYDKTWKTISQKAQISDKYADDFKQIFIGANDARYKDKENMMMMWIQEQNPTLDPTLYRELGQAVEAQRNEYLGIVKTQISVAQAHNTKVTSSGAMVPCGILRLIGNPRQVCDTVFVRQVTSSRTQNSFETGKDDETKLFGNQ